MSSSIIKDPITTNKITPELYKETLLKSTFYFTYVFLLTTGTITFIEALRNDDAVVRHIMNVETCVSIVAAFFYSIFVEKIKASEGKEIPFEDINITRYTDWFITTPLMLLALCMVLGVSNEKAVKITTYLTIIILNFGMLIFGYLGEIKRMDKRKALLIGFVFFFAMFWVIWTNFIGENTKTAALVSYFIFFVIWSIYGVVYLADDKTKNITFNILDLIAKALVGLCFWLYFTKAVEF
jgi:bacteriorhodopsin